MHRRNWNVPAVLWLRAEIGRALKILLIIMSLPVLRANLFCRCFRVTAEFIIVHSHNLVVSGGYKYRHTLQSIRLVLKMCK